MIVRSIRRTVGRAIEPATVEKPGGGMHRIESKNTPKAQAELQRRMSYVENIEQQIDNGEIGHSSK